MSTQTFIQLVLHLLKKERFTKAKLKAIIDNINPEGDYYG